MSVRIIRSPVVRKVGLVGPGAGMARPAVTKLGLGGWLWGSLGRIEPCERPLPVREVKLGVKGPTQNTVLLLHQLIRLHTVSSPLYIVKIFADCLKLGPWGPFLN